MCGILGIINIENGKPIEKYLLEDMASTMAHRGPDGAGVWVQNDGQCGLAHRRLSILDLTEAGHQPMASEDEQVWITFNGEIYNYPQLRKFFEDKGHRFKSNSDTEIILHLYEEYGEQFYEYLDGDFGIGLWDCKEQKLILARDQAGVKPVYYTHFDGRFIFASEIKAILKYPGIEKNIDAVSFYHYLSFLVVPPPKTLIHNIFKLEAASVLKIGRLAARKEVTKKFWLPVSQVNNNTNFSELDEELKELFSRSVKKRLLADVPVGLLFSGGVDSTLNLCFFKKLIAPQKVKTFTVGMKGASNFQNDSDFARQMAKLIGSEHHEIFISEQDLLAAAQKLAYLQDEPISDPVAVPLYFVTKLAKENGVTVLQAGEGADEIFCGYDNYRRFLRHYDTLWRPLSRFPRIMSIMGAKLLARSNNPKHRKICDVLLRMAKGQQLFMSSAIAYYELEKQNILSSEFRHDMSQVDSFEVIAPYYEKLFESCPDASILQQITFIELQLRLPELLLMRADKMSMANSLEIRVPFLDRDLINFALRVPDNYKLRRGISKEPIKKLAANYVDKKYIYRPKTGFAVPIQAWFKGQLGTALLDLLEMNNDITEFFNRDVIEHNLHHGLRTVNEAFQMWVIYNVLVWQDGLNCS